MKVNPNKLTKALQLINEINKVQFTDLDLTGFGIVLTVEEKTKILFLHGTKTNIEIITGLVLGKITV